MPVDLHEKLYAAALASNRSLSKEFIVRLQRSFQPQNTSPLADRIADLELRVSELENKLKNETIK